MINESHSRFNHPILIEGNLKIFFVKDSNWHSKYHPDLTNVIKAMKSKSIALINGSALYKVALKQWQQGTGIRRHISQALYGFLRFCMAELQFESTWLPPAVTDKDLIITKKLIGYLLTDYKILRELNYFPENETGNKWRFCFQCMAVNGLQLEDLKKIHTRN